MPTIAELEDLINNCEDESQMEELQAQLEELYNQGEE